MERRVAHIVEATDAGVGRHALDLVRGLSAAGWDTHLIYSPSRMGTGFRRSLEAMPAVTAVPLVMKRPVHPHDTWTAWKVAQYLRERGPFDLVHGHSSKGGAIARMAGKLAGVKSAYTPNALVTMNPELGPLKSKLYGAAERILGRIGTVLIAVSDFEAEHAVSLGIDPETVTVVGNGIPLERLPDRDTVREELGLDSDALVVGFVGRLFDQKAPDVLLKAFAKATTHETAILAMVGDGPLRPEMEALTEKLGISSRIRWLGAQNGQRCMPAFDLFVLPSNYEGMPYVVLEAAHAGLPIIATRVSGVASVVRDGENGFTVAIGDVDSMATALDALISNADLRKEFSRTSLSRIQEWTVERMVGDTLRVYDQILGGSIVPAPHLVVKCSSGQL